VTAKFPKFVGLLGAVALSATTAGCGSSFVRDGQSPVRLVIVSLQGASGASPTQMSTVTHSDVITLVTTGGSCSQTNPCPTTFGDPGRVELRVLLRDQGNPDSPTSPSLLNSVTIERYHVEYRRADGHNVQGVDVPYAFDGAATFTVPSDGSASAGFTLVRNVAKDEAPLATLTNGETLITTIAYVTFYGHDQTGHEISVTGTIEVTFGNFGDPA
jgi:hypothetical protein